MTGTTGDIIVIVIVPVVILAFWLVIIFYAASHPLWRGQTLPDAVSTPSLPGNVPAQRLSGSGPVVPGQRLDTGADDVTPGQAPAGETRS